MQIESLDYIKMGDISTFRTLVNILQGSPETIQLVAEEIFYHKCMYIPKG